MAFKPIVLSNVSLLALMLGAPAWAQGTQDAASAAQPAATEQPLPTAEEADVGEDIVVTGVRASLSSAQSLKKQSVQIVDSIVAEDIGKLPDNTVSDALQRVTGVQVTRGAGEAGTVLIRGLPNTATLLNGREAFTGTGRGVALQDIPAELLAGVDVYKSSTPDLVEGGVAGVIDVRLRRPLDFKGLEIAGGGRGVYSDQSEKWGYLGSGLIANRWDTGIGEIGAMLGGAYNRRQYQDNTAFNFISSNGGANNIGIPDTVGGTYTDGDRRRMAFNGSVQWRPSPDLEFYADGLYTQFKNKFATNFFIGLPKAGDVTATPSEDTPGLAGSTTTLNAYTLTSKQAYENKTTTWQADVGGKWTTGNAVLSTEVTYSKSRVSNRNVIVDTSFNAPVLNVDFDNGGTPLVSIPGVDLTDPSIYTLRTLFDNVSLATSRQWAWRNDILYTFDDGLLTNFKIGTRYTNRRAVSQATLSEPIAIANPVLLSSIAGLASLSPDGLVNGKAGIGRFALADTDFLLDNTDEIRRIFGQAAGDRAFAPSLAFFDDERTYAFYGQVGYGFDIGSVRVDGVAGARVVNTVQNLVGDGVSARDNYVNVLPSINARVALSDKVQIRLAAGKTVTRPEFAQLNPLVGYTFNGDTGGNSTAYTGAGGNPNLQPIKSTAYDVTFEWYPSRTTSITAAGFYRDLDGYIQTYSETEDYLGIDDALVSRPRNTGPGSLKGVELAYQQFFDFLPGPLAGLGAQLNGTYIIGNTEDPINGGQQRLVNVSKYSYNVIAIYEKYGVSARLAYNWRSSFVDSYNAGGVQANTIVAEPTGQLDFSGSYALTPWLTLTADATNLTNRTYRDRFKGVNGTGVYSSTPRDTRTYDRTFEVGARFKF